MENKDAILLTLSNFHFEMSGRYSNNEHPYNKKLMFSTLFVFQFDISGNFFKDEHS